LKTPGVDTAGHTLAGFHSLAAKPVHYIQTAHPVVAKDNERRPVVMKRFKMLLDGAHGDQLRPFNPANLVFFRLTNIDEANRIAPGNEGCHLDRGNFTGQCGCRYFHCIENNRLVWTKPTGPGAASNALVILQG
jgi:hypothetical protein